MYVKLKYTRKYGFISFKSKMNSTPVRAIQINIPASEAYSLESVGKHGFGECVCACVGIIGKKEEDV